MDLLSTLRTTGAVRAFTDEPVALATIYDLLDVARFAPNGGNRQAWRVVVVTDPAQRRRLRDLYLPGWYQYLAQSAAGLVPWAPVTDPEREAEAIASAPGIAAAAAAGPGGFAERLDEAPALLLLLADLRYLAAVDRDAPHYTLIGGGSIYPFAWSILLAARAHGLGGVMTTMPALEEEALRHAFGLTETQVFAGLLALGHPVHQPTKLRRGDVASFATVDRADGPAFERP